MGAATAMRTPSLCAVTIMLVIMMTSGCQLFSASDIDLGSSPLIAAHSSPDSVAMEIIWVRLPPGDADLSDDAWHEIDETQVDPSVRRELANNGFRVGVIGGTVPAAIASALNMNGSPPNHEATTNETDAEDLASDPVVHGRIQQVRRNQRTEIQASDVYPTLPLLTTGGSELSGRTYEEAQAIYALKVDPQPDRTALVELTPELHHGSPRIQWTRGDDGIGVLRQAPLRDREVFNELQMSVRLAPGEMLVLMSMPDARSRLADYFHMVDSSEGRQPKLILIRLAEVPMSDTFAVD
jgi:hypothetical protein